MKNYLSNADGPVSSGKLMFDKMEEGKCSSSLIMFLLCHDDSLNLPLSFLLVIYVSMLVGWSF